MIYYSAFEYAQAHPEIGLEKAANELNMGKSNQKVLNDMLTRAGL